METKKSFSLQIEHKAFNFDEWKKTFDSDPIDRKKSGVLSYRIFRPTDDPDYVIVDMEFDNLKNAQDTLSALKNLWIQAEGKVMINPQTRIVELIENKVY